VLMLLDLMFYLFHFVLFRQVGLLLNIEPIAICFNPFSPACATFLAELCNPITYQTIELESCSNSLRIQQVL